MFLVNSTQSQNATVRILKVLYVIFRYQFHRAKFLSYKPGVTEMATVQERTLSFVTLACLVLAAYLSLGSVARAVTDDATMTDSEYLDEIEGIYEIGFDPTYSIGSISPTKMADGKTYGALFDNSYDQSFLTVKGFTSNPGQDWLTSVKCNSKTQTGSGAYTYMYNAGSATWKWLGVFGFNLTATGGSKEYPCVFVHS